MEVFGEQFSFVFLRLLGCFLMFPGGYSVFPFTMRLGVSLILSLAFFDSVDSLPVSNDAHVLSYPLEVGIGMLLIFPFSLAMKGFLMFGSLLEQGRGQNLGGMYGAGTEQEGDGQLGKFFETGVLVLLLSSGFLLELVEILLASFQSLPPGSISFHSGWHHFGVSFLSYNLRVLVFSFTLFLPFGMLFVLSDLAIGLISKVVPGVPIFAEMFVAKSAVTFLVILTVLIPSFTELPRELLAGSNQVISSLFQAIGG